MFSAAMEDGIFQEYPDLSTLCDTNTNTSTSTSTSFAFDQAKDPLLAETQTQEMVQLPLGNYILVTRSLPLTLPPTSEEVIITNEESSLLENEQSLSQSQVNQSIGKDDMQVQAQSKYWGVIAFFWADQMFTPVAKETLRVDDTFLDKISTPKARSERLTRTGGDYSIFATVLKGGLND